MIPALHSIPGVQVCQVKNGTCPAQYTGCAGMPGKMIPALHSIPGMQVKQEQAIYWPVIRSREQREDRELRHRGRPEHPWHRR